MLEDRMRRYRRKEVLIYPHRPHIDPNIETSGKQVELNVCFGASWWTLLIACPRKKKKTTEKLPLVINWKWCSYENNNKSDLAVSFSVGFIFRHVENCLTYSIGNTAQIIWFHCGFFQSADLCLESNATQELLIISRT